MTPKKQSSLQEAIELIKAFIPTEIPENDFERGKKIGYENVVSNLKRFLPKEQQTFSDIFDAGYNRRDFEQMPFVEHQLDKAEFLNQYKPEP